MDQKKFNAYIKSMVTMMKKSNQKDAKKLEVKTYLYDTGTMETGVEVCDKDDERCTEVPVDTTDIWEMDGPRGEKITEENWENLPNALGDEFRYQCAVESALDLVNSMTEEEFFEEY